MLQMLAVCCISFEIGIWKPVEADEDVSNVVAVSLPCDKSAVSLNKDDAVDRLKDPTALQYCSPV